MYTSFLLRATIRINVVLYGSKEEFDLEKAKILSEDDRAHFMELGWVRVQEAYSRADALAAQDDLWREVEKRGILREDRATWTVPLLRMNENYDTPSFRRCNTDRLKDAIEDVVGRNRWIGREQAVKWGWWPVNFAHGANQAWDVPVDGWHWDGIHFKHRVDSPDQGLLCLCVFSDVLPRGGGTIVAEGSHKVVARYLAEQPDGVDLGDGIRAVMEQHEWFRALSGRDPLPEEGMDRKSFFMNPHTDSQGTSLRVVETTALAGDVILCHPFLFHATSQNLSGVPRFMCNRTTPLREKLQLDRADEAAYSTLELSIRRAMTGVECL